MTPPIMPSPRPEFSITVLGSGTCTPSATRGTAAYLVTAGPARYLVDSGSGTIARLAAVGVPVHDLDALFYTHLHLDHSGDLFNILFSLRNASGLSRRRDLPIYGARGFSDHFDKLMDLYDKWVLSPDYRISACDLAGEGRRIALGPVTVEAFPARHSACAAGYRFTFTDGAGSRSLAFTGDTDDGAEVAGLLAGVDLAVIECSTPDESKIDGHLSPGQVGRLARDAGVGAVVLTHFYPPLAQDPSPAVAQVAALCGRPVVAAWDGGVFEVRSPSATIGWKDSDAGAMVGP